MDVTICCGRVLDVEIANLRVLTKTNQIATIYDLQGNARHFSFSLKPSALMGISRSPVYLPDVGDADLLPNETLSATEEQKV